MTPVDITEGDKSLNRDYIMTLVTRALERFDKHIGDGSYTVDEAASEMVYIKGAGQITLDAEAVYNKAVEGLKALESSVSYTLPAQDVKAPDFEALHTELMREPQDAYYDKETGEIVPDVKGFAFDASEAEKLWNAAGLLEEVRIPVKIDMPGMTEEQAFNEATTRAEAGIPRLKQAADSTGSHLKEQIQKVIIEVVPCCLLFKVYSL